jgi:7-cyano-7-deazaguanine tRNA-ribosyltransferase
MAQRKSSTAPACCAEPSRPENCFRVKGPRRHSPKMWFGHDLKSRLRIWAHVRDCPGVILSAHQVLMRNECFLRKCGAQGLHSFLDYRGPIFLDSGGFHFQHDGQMSIGVTDLLRTQAVLRPDVTAVLDLPLHPRASSRENARRWRQTLDNTGQMLARSGGTLAVVVHSYNAGHTMRRCQQLRLLSPDPPVVCIGSLVPLLRGQGVAGKFVNGSANNPRTHQRWRYIIHLIRCVRAAFPNALLHVFGAGTLSSIWFFYILGVDSVDSVAWRLKAAYGAIRLPALGDRYVADFTHTRTRRRTSAQCLRLLEVCRCSACDGLRLRRRLAVLAESFKARAVHNAQVFIDELNAYSLAARQGTHLEFVYDRLADNPRYREIFSRTILPNLIAR